MHNCKGNHKKPESVIERESQYHTKRGTIAALEWGDPGAPSILALHGWLDNAASFSRFAEQFMDYHIVAIDLPGHGKSDHRSVDASYTIVDYVEDIVCLLDQLNWTKYDLLGHSLGASIASLVAVIDPELIGNLLLIDGIGALSEPAEEAPTRLSLSMRKRRIRNSNGKLQYPDIDQAIKARLRVSDLSYDSAEVLVRRGTDFADGGYRWRCDRRLLNPSPLYMTEEQVLSFLSALRVRTLLVQAESGILGNRPVLSRRIEAIRDLSVIKIPGGHHLHMDNPVMTAEVVRAFLEANQPS